MVALYFGDKVLHVQRCIVEAHAEVVFAWPLRSQLDRASVTKRIRPTAVPVRRYLLHARREQTNFVELDLAVEVHREHLRVAARRDPKRAREQRRGGRVPWVVRGARDVNDMLVHPELDHAVAHRRSVAIQLKIGGAEPAVEPAARSTTTRSVSLASLPWFTFVVAPGPRPRDAPVAGWPSPLARRRSRILTLALALTLTLTLTLFLVSGMGLILGRCLRLCLYLHHTPSHRIRIRAGASRARARRARAWSAARRSRSTGGVGGGIGGGGSVGVGAFARERPNEGRVLWDGLHRAVGPTPRRHGPRARRPRALLSVPLVRCRAGVHFAQV
mmetsp:Transcript_48006/g.134039  ORF Transcript_48006/g.134039 Transcript_48006/m.134039 type:complete len:330 (+) Transcript_48006:384-1373(+)